MRKYVVMALAIVAVMAVAFGLVTAAVALPTFTTGVGTVPACATCHTQSGTHAITNHASLACASCHAVNTATPPTPHECGACHGGVSTIIAASTHVTTGCNSTPGCHGVPTSTTGLYTDVKPTDYFYSAVNELSKDGIVSGYKNANGTSSFKPYDNVARAQFAKMIVGGLGLHTASIETTTPTFNDVTTIATYPYDFVEEAFAEGIIFGYNNADGTMSFRPSSPIIRLQIALMVVRGAEATGIMLAAPGATDTFTDIGGLPASIQLAIRTCAANGIVNGYANGNGTFSFKPSNNATRGQAAVMLFRLMAKMPS